MHKGLRTLTRKRSEHSANKDGTVNGRKNLNLESCEEAKEKDDERKRKGEIKRRQREKQNSKIVTDRAMVVQEPGEANEQCTVACRENADS